MVEIAKEILPVNIEDELKQSYLDYAMSVIVGRALPDVRDGLKPVHRRVLFAMNQLNNDWNKPYKKSARVVGDVIGKYHPHGDSAVYDTIVRMAQPFSLRYLLVDGQGNFGSVDGDNAAAMRYTEIRMSKIAHELLADLDKETVDFVPNYDGSEQMPSVLPTKVPALLVNGSSGIAVGMATNIPPHNLTEIISGCLALIDDPELSVDGLMQYIKGPDFPTSAIINGRAGIVQAYRTGRGRIYIRSKAEIESDEKTNKQTIIVTEIPYQVNKARLIEKIAELVKDKKIEGITELRDESDKDGMRIVIELRRGENGEVVLNNLYSQTQLETVFGINMVALVDGQPRILNLKQILECFVKHRREVVTRRTVYLLRKARERGHILEGLAVALANIDPVIAAIKASQNTAEAREKLLSQGWQPGDVLQMLEKAGEQDICRPDDLSAEFGLRDGKYYLSVQQAQAILDLRLQKLTGLEHEKLINEYQEKLDIIRQLGEILANPQRLMQVIREELVAIKEEYGDDRRSEIISSRQDLTAEDLITEEQVVLTISHLGYAKTQPISVYRAQRRGGRGISATAVKEEDYIEHLLIASTHDTILCFTNRGKVYWLRVFQVPQAGRAARGKPIINLLPLEDDEKITSILPLKANTNNEANANEGDAEEGSADEASATEGDSTGGYVFMATEQGTVKKVPVEQFSRPRSAGLIALELTEDDRLIGTAITTGDNNVLLVSSEGKAIHFKESDVRPMGRTARGVRGIKLSGGHKVISLIIGHEGGQLLTASFNGYGKRTNLEEFSIQGRGGQGVIAMVTNERNGQLVGAVQADEEDEIFLISDQGTLVRTRVAEVSRTGRNTQGVKLIRLAEDEHLVGLSLIQEPEGAKEQEEGDEAVAEIDEDGDADVSPESTDEA